MSHILTLIAPPDGAPLGDRLLAAAAAVLPEAGAVIWLEHGRAVDIPFAGGGEDARGIASRVRRTMADARLDLAVQPAAGRRKRLLVADMDSTMIGQECIDELADFAGLKPQVAAITERAMRGEIAFEPALRERVALLAGLPVEAIGSVLRERIRPSPGARSLIATMRAQGARTVLVSGGFTAFTGPVAATIGFDEHHANTLLVEDGRLTGKVAEPILGREAKLATLNEASARLGLERAETLAVGDGANDLGMVLAAGLGVAFHAKPVVAGAAPVRIDYTDLTALLFIQGYRREEFAS